MTRRIKQYIKTVDVDLEKQSTKPKFCSLRTSKTNESLDEVTTVERDREEETRREREKERGHNFPCRIECDIFSDPKNNERTIMEY